MSQQKNLSFSRFKVRSPPAGGRLADMGPPGCVCVFYRSTCGGMSVLDTYRMVDLTPKTGLYRSFQPPSNVWRKVRAIIEEKFWKENQFLDVVHVNKTHVN